MKCLTLLLLLLVAVTNCHNPLQVIFQWKTVDFVWPSDDERQYAVAHNDYIPANNFIAGIKFWKGKMYLTLPRWSEGVPVTLAVTSATPLNGDTAPKLQPFPSWEKQKIGDCSAFQMVQSMEIDPKGRMWVLDSGRLSPLAVKTKAGCPPRLVILDLEKEGQVLRSYEFPQDVARPSTTHLNDIVLDHEDGGLAYITDSDREDPGIIVYSLQNNTSWKIRHDSMKAKPEAVTFMISKTMVNIPIPVDSIALSPASSTDRQIYYSPLSSFNLYSLPAWVLKNNMSNVESYVKEWGKKNSQTDGMMMSATGVLYFGLLADDAVAMWDTEQSKSFITGKRVISRDHDMMQWPDTFAFDEYGNFYCVSNALQNVLNNKVDVNVPNYRVIKSKTDVKSYQYLVDGSAPEQPEIPTSAANKIKLAVAIGLGVLLTLVVH